MTMTPQQPSSRITVDGPDGGEPKGRRNRWLLPVVALLVVGSIWSFRGEATPEDDPVDLDSVKIVTTTSRPHLDGDLSQGWLPIDLPGQGEVVEVLDTSFGLFAAVNDSDGAVLWRSSDALNWTQVPVDDDGVFLGAEVNAIVETEYGLVAVGAQADAEASTAAYVDVPEDRRMPGVWVSDDGSRWNRLSTNDIGPSGAVEPNDEEASLGSMNDVIIWNDHLVAVGWSSSAVHAGAAWVGSLDGRSWKHATEGLSGWGTRFTEVEAVATLGDTLVAVGSTLARPVVWTSHDAMSWTAADSGHGLGTLRHDWPAGIITRPAGVVAVGKHQIIEQWSVARPDYPVAWTSQDGVGWVRLAAKALGRAAFNDVLAADPFLVAVGSAVDEGAGFRPAAWFAIPGSDWQTVDLSVEGYEYGHCGVNSVTTGGPGLIAGGTIQGMPQLWVWSETVHADAAEDVWKRPETGRWVQRAEFDPGFPAWSLGSVFDDYVAVGERTVWRSKDGVEWSSESLGEAGLEPGRWYSEPVTVGDTAFLTDSEGGLWSSSDGWEWERLAVEFEGWLEGPFPGLGGELLITENLWDSGELQLWRSVDGLTWSRMPVPDVEWFTDVQVVWDQYAILGWSPGGPSLWLSPDGETWEEQNLGEPDNVDAMAVLDDRLVMLTVEGDGWLPPAKSVLVTDDGREWERYQIDAPGWPGEMTAYSGGVVMMLHEESSMGESSESVWTSPDGESWTRLGPLPFIGETWANPLSIGDGIWLRVEGENQPATLWEWVPPEED